MGFRITGNGGVDADVDGTSFRALRVTQKPTDVGALGSYRIAALSGLSVTIAAGTASAGHVFAFRWSDATRLAVIKYLRVRMAVITGFTSAQELGYDAFIARAYTSDHGGGTAPTLGGNNQKMRTSMGTTLVTSAASLRHVSTTALTGSAFTLDANPFMVNAGKTLAAAATVQDLVLESVFDVANGNHYPIVLALNEGIVVRNSVLMGAAGAVRWGFECAWDEVTAY